VSTAEQAEFGASLAAQAATLTEAAQARELAAELVAEPGRSGADLTGRPALICALDRLDAGAASTLIVTRLDRLSRSVIDFAAILDRSRRSGWRLVVLDVAVDTATPTGELMATVAAAFAQYERRLISARTREALAQRKAEGKRLGRPVVTPAEVATRIVAERAAGSTLAAIGAGLERDGTPTVRGGARWYPSTVAAVLASVALDADAAHRAA
jgi:DNA invertase Pin-like site-specific DNA recombinase